MGAKYVQIILVYPYIPSYIEFLFLSSESSIVIIVKEYLGLANKVECCYVLR